MSYTRETLAAFSESLGALYRAESPVAALQAALPGMRLMLRSRRMFVDERPHDGGVPTFEQMGFYREVFEPAKLRDRLHIAVRLPCSTVGVTFHRDTAFTDDETFLVGLLRPHIAAGIQSARNLVHAEREMPNSATWRIPVSADGTLVHLPRDFVRALSRYFPDMPDRTATGLPDELERWLKHTTRELRSLGPVSPALEPWGLERPAGHLRLQLVPDPDSAPLLRATEARGAVDYYRLRAVGLTPRECEVVFWISQGKRDAEIAAILGCATKTVGKHVENLLAKLGGETRLAAAHAAQEWLRFNT